MVAWLGSVKRWGSLEVSNTVHGNSLQRRSQKALYICKPARRITFLKCPWGKLLCRKVI